MRILIVDDSATMRNIQRTFLQMHGYHEVQEACDGLDALNKAEAFQPDFLLVDRDMPTMDGMSFVKQYRAQGGGGLIVMVLSEAEKSRRHEAFDAGANNTIVKPFSPDLLSRCILETLERNAAA